MPKDKCEYCEIETTALKKHKDSDMIVCTKCYNEIEEREKRILKEKTDCVKRWEDKANKLFKGRKIVGVRYMTDEEQKEMMWHAKAPVFILDNGVAIFPSMDDEGNDAGSMFASKREYELPVI